MSAQQIILDILANCDTGTIMKDHCNETLWADISSKVGRPKILLSSCLAGQPVRYDGTHKYLGDSFSTLNRHLEIVTFCPEVAAGFGTPRPTIERYVASDREQGVRLTENKQDLSKPLHQAAEAFIDNLPSVELAILKARSPSCGSGSTPVARQNGQWTTGDGIFVDLLKRRVHPFMPIVDESYLEGSHRQCQRLINGCYINLLNRHELKNLFEDSFKAIGIELEGFELGEFINNSPES